jgi:hypothetical protein
LRLGKALLIIIGVPQRVNRSEALIILKEVVEIGGNPSLINLKKTQSDSYELHIRPQVLSFGSIKDIAERNNLKSREDTGFIFVFDTTK